MSVSYSWMGLSPMVWSLVSVVSSTVGPLVLLAALGGLSIVGLLVTVGARMRLPDRPASPSEYVAVSEEPSRA